jgi:hypothetical protein
MLNDECLMLNEGSPVILHSQFLIPHQHSEPIFVGICGAQEGRP